MHIQWKENVPLDHLQLERTWYFVKIVFRVHKHFGKRKASILETKEHGSFKNKSKFYNSK